MLSELVTFTQWLLSRDHLARSTVKTYVTGVRVFAHWWEAERRPLRTLSTDDIHRFIAWRLEQGATAATVNRTLVALRHFCCWAKRRRRLERDPMPRVVNLRVHRTVSVLSRESLEHLLDVVRRDKARRGRLIALLLLRARLHPGDLAALRVGDVVLTSERRELRLRRRKGAAPARLVIDDELANALAAYLGRDGRSTDALLFSDDGQPLSRRSVEVILATYGQAAALNGLTWRALQKALVRTHPRFEPAEPDSPLSLLDVARRTFTWRLTPAPAPG